MSSKEEIIQDLARQILHTHDRFAAAMSARLPGMDLEQRERYFAVLSTLVSKLEDRSKPLKQVLQEVVSEVLPVIMAELQS